MRCTTNGTHASVLLHCVEFCEGGEIKGVSFSRATNVYHYYHSATLETLAAERYPLVYAVNLSFQFSCFTQVHSARDEVEEGQRGLFMVQAGRAARAAPSFATS